MIALMVMSATSSLQDHIRPKAFSRWLSGSSHRFVLIPRREGSKIRVIDRGAAAAVIWIPFCVMALLLCLAVVQNQRPWRSTVGMGSAFWLGTLIPLALACALGYRPVRAIVRRSMLLIDQQQGIVWIEQSWPRQVREECQIDECTVVLCSVYMSRRWGLTEDGHVLLLLTPREYFTLGIHTDRNKLLESDVVRAIGKPVIESSECIWARSPL